MSKGQVTAANSLEEVFILALEVQDEIIHCIFLVPWPRKVLREATSTEIHCHFREASSSADGSDVGVRKATVESQGTGSREWESSWTLDTIRLSKRVRAIAMCINHLDTIRLSTGE